MSASSLTANQQRCYQVACHLQILRVADTQLQLSHPDATRISRRLAQLHTSSRSRLQRSLAADECRYSDSSHILTSVVCSMMSRAELLGEGVANGFGLAICDKFRKFYVVWNYNLRRLRSTSKEPAYYKFARVCHRGCLTTAPAAHSSLHMTLMRQRQSLV